ncbi:MAG: hypothetical protein EBZ69_04435 [Alphaproteobacteria bacterium]|nr:hypothetical protein [Alphaproteobacteria bacterium]NDG04262.1 hypothetical protein [Alphaproteobacteria bacterium]
MVIGSAGSAHAQNFQFWPPQNFEGPRAGLPKCQAGDMTVVRTDLNPSGVYCQKPAAGLPVCPANQVLVSDGTKFNCQPTTTIAPPAGQSCAATVRSCCGTAIPISPLQHLQIYSGQHNNNGTGPGGLLSYGSPMVYCVYQCVNGVVLSQSDGFSCRFEQTPPDRDGNY